jgi:hypothetical protein
MVPLDSDRSAPRESGGATDAVPEGSRPYAVSTYSLVAYLLTVLAWELEVGILLLYWFNKGNLDPLGHAALLALSCSLTLFSWIRGKREFQRLCWTRGRIPVTASQSIFVAVMVVTFGGLMTWIGARLFDL